MKLEFSIPLTFSNVAGEFPSNIFVFGTIIDLFTVWISSAIYFGAWMYLSDVVFFIIS